MSGVGVGAWSREDRLFLALLLVAFLLSRVLWIACAPASTTYWEESYRWAAAHELLSQPSLSLLDYQADHYQGGSLMVVLLVLPFFALLGESLLSFKLAALLLSSLTLGLLYTLSREFFGARCARLAGLAYLLAPPLVAFWGVVPMGFHPDSSALSLAQIFVYLGLLTGRWEGASRARAWLAFGLACGAGISFTYITALSAGACVLAWVVLRPLPPWRDVAWGALGGLVGLVPWLAYNLTHDFAGAGRLVQLLGDRAATVDAWPAQGLGAKGLDLLIEMPVRGLLDPSGAGLPFGLLPIVALAFVVPVALGLAAGLVRMGRLLRGMPGSAARPERDHDQASEARYADGDSERELVFFVYAALFVLAYLASPFNLVGETHMILYRFFPPLAVVMITPLAISAGAALGDAAGLRRLGTAATVAALAASAVATIGFALRSPEPSGVSLEHGYRIAGRLAHRKYPSLPRALASVSTSDPETRALALWGIGWEIQHRFEIGGDLEAVDASLTSVPSHDREAIVEGMRWACQERIKTLISVASPTPYQREALERTRALRAMLATRHHSAVPIRWRHGSHVARAQLD